MDFAVIFDMDGVIVDSNPYHLKAWQLFCTKYRLELDIAYLKNKVFGSTGHKILPVLFDKDLSAEMIQDHCDEINSIYRDLYKGKVQTVPGVIGLLDTLVRNDVRFAVATSAPPENVEFILSETGLYDKLRLIVDDSQVNKCKPDPEIFLKAADLLNTDPGSCIVLEDSLSGIEAGKNAGMKVIAVATTHSHHELHEADMVIDDMTDLKLEAMEIVLIN